MANMGAPQRVLRRAEGVLDTPVPALTTKVTEPPDGYRSANRSAFPCPPRTRHPGPLPRGLRHGAAHDEGPPRLHRRRVLDVVPPARPPQVHHPGRLAHRP